MRLHPNQIKRELAALDKSDKHLRELELRYLKAYKYLDLIDVRKALVANDEKRKSLQAELANYDKTTLNRLLPDDEAIRNKVYMQLIEISLAADYQVQALENFRDTLDSLEIESADIFKEVHECVHLAQKTATRLLIDKAPALSNMLLDNTELLDNLHSITEDYISKNIKR